MKSLRTRDPLSVPYSMVSMCAFSRTVKRDRGKRTPWLDLKFISHGIFLLDFHVPNEFTASNDFQMGPTIPEASQWGVNYRALHDLFLLSHERSHITEYTIGVQMVEIYNEQIRDLLDSQNSTKKYPFNKLEHLYPLCLDLPFLNFNLKPIHFSLTSFLTLEIRKLENGSVRIPDAKSIKVHSTEDVAILMKQGAKTRSVGTTNMNERSSRSHRFKSLAKVFFFEFKNPRAQNFASRFPVQHRYRAS